MNNSNFKYYTFLRVKVNLTQKKKSSEVMLVNQSVILNSIESKVTPSMIHFVSEMEIDKEFF